MRQKLLALLAVSSLALAGCSAAAPAPTPAETPSASATSNSPVPANISELTPDTDASTKAEVAFLQLAQSPLSVAGTNDFTREELISALHNFCDDGKPMNLTDDESSNEYLDNMARSSCENIDK